MPSEYLQVARFHIRQMEALMQEHIASPDTRDADRIVEAMASAQRALSAVVAELETRGGEARRSR